MFVFNYEKRNQEINPFRQKTSYLQLLTVVFFTLLSLPVFAMGASVENSFIVNSPGGFFGEEFPNCNCPGGNALSNTPVDTEPPIITLIHPGLQGLSHGDTLYFGCGQQMNFDVNSAIVVDNCDPNPSLEFVDYNFRSSDCFQSGFYREIVCGWVASDECNNKDSIVITFLLTDDTPPVFDPMPDTLTVECSAINAYFPSAKDDCGGRVFITRDDTIMPGTCEGEKMIMRTWIANDLCGNEARHEQVLLVEDTTPPVLGDLPNDTLLSCDEIIPTPAAVIAIDNCSSGNLVDFDESSTGDDCNRVITRTWTATDDCGNTSTGTQIITVRDTTAPAFVYTPDDSIAVECDQPTPDDQPVFLDNCDTGFAIVRTSDSTNLDCGWQVIKTWTATDRCGNSTFFQQKIQGIDTQVPVFDNPPVNDTVECDAIPAPIIVTASDNCDTDVLVEMEEEILGALCGNYRILRTWTATDDCGNFSTHRQRIDIEDTTPPVLFGVPADTTIECQITPDMPVITATDNCDDDPMIAFSEGIRGDSCFLYLERTWTAEDACGNTVSQTQTITLTDFSAPFLSFSHPDIFGGSDGDTIRYECTDVVYFDAGDVTVIDNCDDAVRIDFTIEELVSDDCEADGYIGRVISTWTATDNCGNSSEISLTTLIIDTTDPILLNVPADITISCEMPLPLPLTVDVEDNCDDSVNAVFYEDFEDVLCNQRVIRTWTATDDCGNFSVGTQIITLIDTTGPVPTFVPVDVTIECDDPIPSDEPIFEDACLTKFSVSERSDTIPQNCGFVIQKFWTATDDCGNTSTAFQIITAEDSTPPTFDNMPDDATIACDDIPAPPNVTATDNCDAAPVVTFSEETFGGGNCNNWEIIRTWTATDNCGNQRIEQQVLTISDNTPPVFDSIPADITIECDEDLPTSNTPNVTDNCDDDVYLVFDDVRTDGNCIGEYIVTRTWTATDLCGNTTTATQIISAVDRTPPVITFVHPFLVGHMNGDTIEIQCDNLVLLNDEDAEATDNCSTPDVVFDEQIIRSGNCASDGFIEILECSWTATDDCGNQSTASVIVVVKDDSPPVFENVPADTTLNCGDVIPGINMPTVTDNCDPTVFATLEETMQGNGCAGGLNVLRTWTATDLCGNTTTTTQLITYIDNTPPTLTFADPDLAGANDGDIVTIDCNDLIQLDENSITASDFCDDNPTIVFNEVTNSNFDCPVDGYFSELVATWIATDACGNSDSVMLTFRIADNEPPIFDNIPSDATIGCDEVIPDPANVTATDACIGVTVEMDETSMPGNCPGALIVTRTWTATDDCGNSTTASQVITQEDLSAPTATILDTLLNSDCNDIPQVPTPVITDDCDLNPLVEYSEITIDGSCTHSYTIRREWTVTDGCGNQSVLTQTVNVVDTEAPVLGNVPGDLTVSCDAIPPVETDLMPSDNCDMSPTIEFNEIQTGTDCSNFVLVREWIVTDACGNSNIYTQNISLTDSTPPVFTSTPSDMTVDCNDVPVASDPDVSDDCDIAPTISFDENRQDGNCAGEYTLTRTWTASDRCGNISTATQVLTVVDMSAPDITLDFPNVGNILSGTTVTVECDSLPVLDENSVEVTDCGIVTNVDFIEKIDVSDNCIVDGYLTLMECTWIASDDCGNTDSLTIFVRVVDTQAPVLIGVPPADTVYLSQGQMVPDPPVVTATDNCDMIDTILFSETSAMIDSCREELLRVWTATDACGNTTVSMQMILVTSKTEVDEISKTDPSCNLSDGTISVSLLGNPANYTYTWVPDIGTPNALGNEHSGLPEGKYTIQAFDATLPGCGHTFIIQLDDGCIERGTDPDDRPELIFHNGVSPNNDYRNETFVIENVERFPGAELLIFNKLGSKVFFQKNYKNDWRGTTSGGQDLPDGTYFYILRWHGEELGKGYLQILR